MSDLTMLGRKAKAAAVKTALYSAKEKNAALTAMAQKLKNNILLILDANEKDLAAAVERGMNPSLQDRLRLTPERIASMADALLEIAEADDPVGETLEEFVRPNGLLIKKVSVPMGVIGVIYEARPNVTTDVAGLCLKAGNATILRGGKEAFHSNNCLANLLREALAETGLDPDAVQLVTDLSRESSVAMMHMTDYLDLLIPRGGAGLIRAVVEESRVPVIQTGVGNCHLYVDETADLSMAREILFNAKVSRPSVCNACESLLVHKAVAKDFLPSAQKRLEEAGVKIFGCEKTREIIDVAAASEEDFATEYLSLQISVKVVDSLCEAIDHIRIFGTHHSEAIVTNDMAAAEKFQKEVDAAAVYVNASTRFTDGGEFGFGGEIGISTQKLHARGPMGIKALTSYQYRILGNGQIR